jgi:RNase P subunit RPR2
MTTDALELRLKFLKEAARTLAISAPAISANMGGAYDSLLAAEERDVNMSRKEWDALRRDLCGSCGSLVVPGWSCTVSHRSHPAKKNKTSSEPKELVYSCLRCDRRTVQALQSRPAKHIRTGARTKTDEPLQMAPSNALATEDSKVTKSVNATSKQRKKARKGGLQAMLDKNKTDASGKNGQLDLMDFLQ